MDLNTLVQPLRDRLFDNGTKHTDVFSITESTSSVSLEFYSVKADSDSAIKNGAAFTAYALVDSTGVLTPTSAFVNGDKIEVIYQYYKYTDSQLLSYIKKSVQYITGLGSDTNILTVSGDTLTSDTTSTFTGGIQDLLISQAQLLLMKDQFIFDAQSAVSFKDGELSVNKATKTDAQERALSMLEKEVKKMRDDYIVSHCVGKAIVDGLSG